MRKADAETAIIAEWRRYATDNRITHPTTLNAFSFFGDLSKNRPDLLHFRCADDKWQVVKGWLLRRGLVTEPHNL